MIIDLNIRKQEFTRFAVLLTGRLNLSIDWDCILYVNFVLFPGNLLFNFKKGDSVFRVRIPIYLERNQKVNAVAETKGYLYQMKQRKNPKETGGEKLSPQVFNFISEGKNSLTVQLSGEWKIRHFLGIQDKILEGLEEKRSLRTLRFDVSAVSGWDSRLVVLLWKIKQWTQKNEVELDLSGLPPGMQRLIQLSGEGADMEARGEKSLDETFLSRIGEASLDVTASTLGMVDFAGQFMISFLRMLSGRAKIRLPDLWLFLQEAGANSLPIISLVSFLVGIVLAFVGAVQLKQFGAQVYVADLVGIGMVREIGALMTAIVLAGRSGAAYAAQLGTMMVNEETDALQTLGLSPMEYLVLPRILAITLMLPPLTLYADFMGIMGGALVGWGMLDISFIQYFEQTRVALVPSQFLLGLVKGGIYGFLVGFAGCMRGMQSGRSAAAVGKAATSAVVTAIVFIVIASAVTTYIYTILGW
jgi:phospholipid/cholesterol/gamma-HCH transport system permease protein